MDGTGLGLCPMTTFGLAILKLQILLSVCLTFNLHPPDLTLSLQEQASQYLVL